MELLWQKNVAYCTSSIIIDPLANSEEEAELGISVPLIAPLPAMNISGGAVSL